VFRQFKKSLPHRYWYVLPVPPERWEPVEELTEGHEEPHRQRWVPRWRNNQEGQKVRIVAMNFSFLKVFLLLNWNVKKIYISYKNIYIKCIKFFLLHNALGSLLWRKLCCLFWLYNNSNIVFVERPVWAPGWRCRERSILSWLRAESWWVEAVLVCNRNSIVLLKSPFAYCSALLHFFIDLLSI